MICESLENRWLLAGPGPAVDSVLRMGDELTSAPSVMFEVTFDESVNGVDLTDFQVETSGVVGGQATQVVGSGSVYTVMVDTGGGDGTLKLNIIDDDSIERTSNPKKPLGGNGFGAGDSGDGSYFAGQAYTIDKTAPTTSGATLVGTPSATDATVDFSLTFTEPVFNIVSGLFSLSGASASTAAIAEVAGSGSSYVITVDTGTGQGDLRVDFLDDDSVTDAAGNSVGGSGSQTIAGQTHLVDHVTGQLAGRVIRDVDRDGYADLNEGGVVGATVYVDVNDNGQPDDGEPFAVSVDDDLSTTEVDESGTYRISGVDPGTVKVRVDPPVGWLLTNPAIRAAASGQLTVVQTLKDNVGDNQFLEEVAGVTQSPDGNFLYVAAYTDDAVSVYSRDFATGALTRVQTVVDGVGGVTGLVGAQSIAVTDDGRHLYVVSAIDDTLAMFERNQSTGLLLFLGALRQGFSGVDGLGEPTAIRQSADGKNLYVAAISSNSLTVFNRDPATGLVTFAQKLTGATAGSFSVDLSPDQRHVYLSSSGSSAVNVYSRDLETGSLSLIQVVSRSTPGYSALHEPWGISVSPDGEHIYVATRLSQGVVVLNRDSATGEVSFNEFVPDPYSFANPDPVAVLVSPDGHHVAVTFQTGGGMAIYSRDSATGALTLVEFYLDGQNGFNDLRGAWDVEFSNDNRSLYLVTAYEDAVYVFDRDVGDLLPTALTVAVESKMTTQLPTFAADNLLPKLESILYAGSTPATADPIAFDVVFSEPVFGVDANDFAVGGSVAGASILSVSGGGTNYTITVRLAPDEQGTLSVGLQSNPLIFDTEGQTLVNDGSAMIDTIDVDRKNPTLVSATRLDTNPTNQSSLRYALTFSESVSGVDASDFYVVGNGLSSGQVGSVTGSGANWVVTISSVSGEGTIQLVLEDDDTITDVVGFPLDGIGSAVLPLETYDIQLGQVQGIVFSDLNSNRIQDAGETGAAGMRVYLDLNQNAVFDTGEPSDVTDADDPATSGTDEAGRYSFTELLDGTYQVRWDKVSPWVQTLPTAGTPQTVPVAVASGISLANFGIHEVLPGSISGRVFSDFNRNAQQGEGGKSLFLVTTDPNKRFQSKRTTG